MVLGLLRHSTSCRCGVRTAIRGILDVVGADGGNCVEDHNKNPSAPGEFNDVRQNLIQAQRQVPAELKAAIVMIFAEDDVAIVIFPCNFQKVRFQLLELGFTGFVFGVTLSESGRWARLECTDLRVLCDQVFVFVAC